MKNARHSKVKATRMPLFADVVVRPKNMERLGHYSGLTGVIERVHKVETLKRDLVNGGTVVASEAFEHLVKFDDGNGGRIPASAWFLDSDLEIIKAAG